MSNVYLLDTDIASYAINPASSDHTVVRTWLNSLRPVDFVHISAVTIGEIATGLRLGSYDAQKQKEFLAELGQFSTLHVDADIATVYAALKEWIYARFAPRDKRGRLKKKRLESLRIGPDKDFLVGENDLWIASTAVAFDLTYVTGDGRQTRIFEAAKDVYGFTKTLVGVGALTP